MTLSPARGTALRVQRVQVRFEPGRRRGASVLDDKIPDIRRLLRSEAPLREIAASFDVSERTLANFIRRRQICDLAERAHFIGRQRSREKVHMPPEDYGRHTERCVVSCTPELAAWLDDIANKAGHGLRARTAREMLEEIMADDTAHNEEAST